jgi:hypothetical protein
MSSKIVFRCSQCEKVHQGLPAIVFDAPSYYYGLDEAARPVRSKRTDNLCVIDGEHHFVRAVLRVPILGESECLEWGVWGTLSRENFERYGSSMHEDDQSQLGPMFSWFASNLPTYPATSGLRCNLIPQDGNCRPLVQFDPEEAHPLVLDTQRGISLERAIEFVRPVLHKH